MKRLTNLFIVCLMSLIMPGCAVDKSGLIKVASKGFSISPPPAGWERQSTHFSAGPSLSRELSSGSLYSIEWKNDDGSSIGLAAVKAVGPNGEPLIITDKFFYSAVHYMREGRLGDLDRLREICPGLTYTKQERYPKDKHIRFKQYDMYQAKLSSRVTCDSYDPLFPLFFDMISIWSDSYYYIFQLTAREGNYDRDSVIFQQFVNTMSPLSEK